jgi:hypothetical protein
MNGSQSARVLDSMALAWHLCGESGKAAGLICKALAALTEEDADLRAELERKLSRYVEAAEEAGLDIEEDV